MRGFSGEDGCWQLAEEGVSMWQSVDGACEKRVLGPLGVCRWAAQRV